MLSLNLGNSSSYLGPARFHPCSNQVPTAHCMTGMTAIRTLGYTRKSTLHARRVRKKAAARARRVGCALMAPHILHIRCPQRFVLGDSAIFPGPACRPCLCWIAAWPAGARLICSTALLSRQSAGTDASAGGSLEETLLKSETVQPAAGHHNGSNTVVGSKCLEFDAFGCLVSLPGGFGVQQT